MSSGHRPAALLARACVGGDLPARPLIVSLLCFSAPHIFLLHQAPNLSAVAALEWAAEADWQGQTPLRPLLAFGRAGSGEALSGRATAVIALRGGSAGKNLHRRAQPCAPSVRISPSGDVRAEGVKSAAPRPAASRRRRGSCSVCLPWCPLRGRA